MMHCHPCTHPPCVRKKHAQANVTRNCVMIGLCPCPSPNQGCLALLLLHSVKQQRVPAVHQGSKCAWTNQLNIQGAPRRCRYPVRVVLSAQQPRRAPSNQHKAGRHHNLHHTGTLLVLVALRCHRQHLRINGVYQLITQTPTDPANMLPMHSHALRRVLSQRAESITEPNASTPEALYPLFITPTVLHDAAAFHCTQHATAHSTHHEIMPLQKQRSPPNGDNDA